MTTYIRKSFKRNNESRLKDRLDNALQRVVKGGTYRHYNTPDLYKVLEIALDEPTTKPVVVYRSQSNGLIWSRSLDNWCESVYNSSGFRTTRFTRILYE